LPSSCLSDKDDLTAIAATVGRHVDIDHP